MIQRLFRSGAHQHVTALGVVLAACTVAAGGPSYPLAPAPLFLVGAWLLRAGSDRAQHLSELSLAFAAGAVLAALSRVVLA